jgi:cytochrome c peroxidase
MAERAFGDGRPVAEGIGARQSTRNAPSLLNVRYHTSFFWDGRRATLESQVLDPVVNPQEHGLANVRAALDTVNADETYVRAFRKIFPNDGVSEANVRTALASFVRSLDPGSSRFDRYRDGHDKGALSDSERRGMQLFIGRAGCSSCHTVEEKSASFTDNDFHSLAVGTEALAATLPTAVRQSLLAPMSKRELLIGVDPGIAALGRFNVTEKLGDIGKYRTPSLRNVAISAPFMHDGSVSTLDEAVELEIYYRSGTQARPLIMTAQEKRDLVAFLQALTAESLEKKPK